MVHAEKVSAYLDVLLMTLPAIFFYGFFMGNLPDGILHSYLYFFSKLILFLLPGLAIISLRGYRLSDFGLTRERLRLSLLLGFGVLMITSVSNALLLSSTLNVDLSAILTWSIPLFFDAFNEEFLFRGVFFLFAYRNTGNLPLSYTVSMLSAFAWHPLELLRMIPVFVQGTLLCFPLYRSGNIYGAWVSHGINRTLASVVAELLKL